MNDRKLSSQLESVLSLLKRTLEALHENAVPADRTLAAAFRENRAFGSRDRRAVNSAVFSFYRRRMWLAKAFGMEQIEKDDLPRSLLCALCTDALDLELAHILCAKTGFDYSEFQRICLLPDSRERFKTFSGTDVDFSELVPAWALPLLTKGAETRYLPYLDRRPPVWIRVQNSDPAETGRILAGNGTFETDKHPGLEHAVKILAERPNLYASPLFRQGKFEVQDLSSQCIGYACFAKNGETWLDACAGGGGKTVQLAAMMHGSGHVFADDVRTYKLDEALERAARGSFRNVAKNDPANKLFDGVLVDAPCSSSGRWRRNPDAMNFTDEKSVAALPDLQYTILEEKAGSVRPGGVLVYGTCSVFKIENSGVVERFLAQHGESFTLESFPDPHTGAQTDGTLQTFPADADCDGSFCARFRRKNT